MPQLNLPFAVRYWPPIGCCLCSYN